MDFDANQQAEFVGQIARDQAALRGYIISLMPGMDGVSDVFQETNLVLWEKRMTFRPLTHFRACLIGSGPVAFIGEWDDVNTVLNWDFQLPQPGSFEIEAEVAVTTPAAVACSVEKSTKKTLLEASGGLENYRTLRLCKFIADSVGDQTLNLKSLGTDSSDVR